MIQSDPFVSNLCQFSSLRYSKQVSKFWCRLRKEWLSKLDWISLKFQSWRNLVPCDASHPNLCLYSRITRSSLKMEFSAKFDPTNFHFVYLFLNSQQINFFLYLTIYQCSLIDWFAMAQSHLIKKTSIPSNLRIRTLIQFLNRSFSKFR